MARHVGPIVIWCDAPAYTIAQACERLGFESPLDVRWLRLSYLRGEGGKGPQAAWLQAVRRDRGREGSCTCGQPLPALVEAVFVLAPGKEMAYLLGQCARCRTIFWDKA
jgi:hypothetical protein